MPNYMLLLNESSEAWDQLSAEEKEKMLGKYMAFTESLRSSDRMRGGDALAPGGRVLRVSNGEVVDGPYTETKEVLGGYYVFEAESLEEATKIAHDCPALLHGGHVIVRPVAVFDESGNIQE